MRVMLDACELRQAKKKDLNTYLETEELKGFESLWTA